MLLEYILPIKHCPQEILFFRQAFNYNRNEHLCSPLFYKIGVCFYLPANRNDSVMFQMCKRGLSAPNAVKTMSLKLAPQNRDFYTVAGSNVYFPILSTCSDSEGGVLGNKTIFTG